MLHVRPTIVGLFSLLICLSALRLSASGAVYGLNQLSDFPGAYVEVRSGWAVGDHGKRRLWSKNAEGVLIKLEGTREGMQLAMGASGILIELQ